MSKAEPAEPTRETMRAMSVEFYSRTSFASPDKVWRAVYEIAAVAARRSAPNTESAKALEFAEYMAKGAEQLLDALNAEDAERDRDDETTEDESTETMTNRIYGAVEARCEFDTGLRSDIYEFRKRASGVVASSQTKPAPDLRKLFYSLNPTPEQERALMRTVWKDGIDLELPNDFFQRLAAALTSPQPSPNTQGHP